MAVYEYEQGCVLVHVVMLRIVTQKLFFPQVGVDRSYDSLSSLAISVV